MGFDDVFCYHGCPLVLDANSSLLVAEIIVATKQLNALLANTRISLFDNFQSIWIQFFQLIPLYLSKLIAILSVPLEQNVKFLLAEFAFKLHGIHQQTFKLFYRAGAVSLPVHKSDHISEFVEHFLFVEYSMQLLQTLSLILINLYTRVVVDSLTDLLQSQHSFTLETIANRLSNHIWSVWGNRLVEVHWFVQLGSLHIFKRYDYGVKHLINLIWIVFRPLHIVKVSHCIFELFTINFSNTVLSAELAEPLKITFHWDSNAPSWQNKLIHVGVVVAFEVWSEEAGCLSFLVEGHIGVAVHVPSFTHHASIVHMRWSSVINDRYIVCVLVGLCLKDWLFQWLHHHPVIELSFSVSDSRLEKVYLVLSLEDADRSRIHILLHF